MPLVRLPRASSRAYRALKPKEEAAQDEQQQQPQAPVDAQGPQTPAANPQLVAALTELKARDAAGLLEAAAAGGTPPLSQLIAAVQGGQLAPREAVAQLRLLCEAAVASNWHGGRKDAAQTASELLDEANEALEEVPGLKDGPDAAPAPPPPPPGAAAKPRLPAETFFLPLDEAVRRCLTLNIDASILQHALPSGRRGGWPLGKRRKEGGSTGGGKRRGRRHFNPWTPEVQQQLATVLRSVLASPTVPGPPETDVAALPPRLAKLAADLSASAAVEQLQGMSVALPNAVGLLQAGAYNEYEELVSDCRDEALAAVEAHLAAQAVDVRRGRLVAHAESFVLALGQGVEAVLNGLRTEHRAARAAAGLPEDSEGELDDDYYPPSLPPCILANKEPFKGGEWRKTPYIPRPYERLQEFHIVEPEMAPAIKRKLATRKHGGCDGKHCQSRAELGFYSVEKEGFNTYCSCLRRNTECDERCACHATPGCLNRSVTRRETLQIGRDAEEVDSWGMDCYVRRNIMDAVLESGAFGPWSPPDYKALAEAEPAEYAAMRAATSAPGGTGASPAAAALAPPPMAAAARQQLQQQEGDGPPGTPAGSGKSSGEHAAAVAAALASPPPTPAQVAVERRAADWLERALLPAVHRQGASGWDLLAALGDVKQRARAAGEQQSLRAAEAVEARIKDVGYNYFRLHPKGVGLVCRRAGGLPPLTFVEEYFGEIHTPWRWFEIQDAVKRLMGDELPDFYNIVLERPRDDPDGYDVLFVDAAAKGGIASRMSHSCTPNCQAIIMACGGRLTIALYTLRHVHEGEELTFDYSSITESEKEFREALCLCSSRNCRGSYLYYTGSRAFQQVMAAKHTFLHRQVIIARAGSEPLTPDDWARIKKHGLGDSALGSVEHGDRAPDWLIKWTSLTLEFMEEEESHLRQDLLTHESGIYNEQTATAEAKGVVASRLQNVVITLDKCKRFLAEPGQPQGACLRLCTDEEATEHVWSGARSVARRVLRGCVQALAPPEVARAFGGPEEELPAAVARHGGDLPEPLARMAGHVMQAAAGLEDARAKLQQLYRQVRALDLDEAGGALTAVADLVLLYASTRQWLACEKDYRGFTSTPVPLNLEDLTLDRAGTGGGAAAAADGEPSGGGSRPGSRPGSVQDLSAAGSESDGGALKDPSALRKVYRPLYVWGQLSAWFKQTINDPSASLSADGRGTVSLPSVESAFAGGKAQKYSAKDRADLADLLEKRPDAMWRTGTIWSFRNDAKIYGSPQLDAAWAEVTRSGGGAALAEVVAELRGAEVPPHMQLAAADGRTATRGAAKKK